MTVDMQGGSSSYTNFSIARCYARWSDHRIFCSSNVNSDTPPSSPQIIGGIAVPFQMSGGIAFRFPNSFKVQTSGSLVFSADDFLALPT